MDHIQRLPEDSLAIHPASGVAPLDPNLAFYLSSEAIDECSVYRLEPQERYLIGKYFSPGRSVLDLACGAARTTLRLHELGFPVVGIDFSEALIGIARRRFPYLDLRVGSYTGIDAPDASFDHVLISSNAIDHATAESDRVTALKECARVLRPGGTLLYSCHNLKCLHLFSPRYWRSPLWKLSNTYKAFQPLASIKEGKVRGIFVAPETAIRQTEACGFHFLEMVGLSGATSLWRNLYSSIFFHFAFRRA